jgi:hypothetical protein
MSVINCEIEKCPMRQKEPTPDIFGEWIDCEYPYCDRKFISTRTGLIEQDAILALRIELMVATQYRRAYLFYRL